MKRILTFILFLGLGYLGCSDAGDDSNTDINALKDISLEDTAVISDALTDIPDVSPADTGSDEGLPDSGFDSGTDITEISDDAGPFDVTADTGGSDIVTEDISVSDIFDTGINDVSGDSAVTDIYEDVIVADEGGGDTDTLQDFGPADIADAGDTQDTGSSLTPPVLKLITASPSPETTVKIGGSANDGTTIYIFKNKDCSVKPVLILPTSSFNSAGADVTVTAGSTTYFSAYVSNGLVNSACSNFVTYVHHNNAYWYISFFDDFKGPQSGEDPECYNIPPQCIGEYLSGLYECPQTEVHSGLSALNKCNWTILRQPNWMAMEYGPVKNGTNGFTPLEVSVAPNTDNGILILSANAYKWDGTKLNVANLTTEEKNCLSQPQSNWLLHENNLPDCRNVVNYNCVWEKNTLNCPVMAGAVYSKKFSSYKTGNTEVKKERGFIQEYGRWEVRAKLPSGMGSFPAHWLLPQSGSWPERGEIDIMEADRYAKESYQTYHTGYCEGSPKPYYPDHQDCTNNGGQRYHLAQGGRLALRSGSFADDYHIFTAEWSKDRIDFYTDNVLVLSINTGDMSYGSFTDYYRYAGQARPMNIPFGEFFIILNQTVHNDSYGNISPLSFITQMHKIDYVKVFDMCSSPSDFCKDGFYFDGNDGYCYPSDSSGMQKAYKSPCRERSQLIPEPQPLNTQLFYNCTNPCPYGGWSDGSNCQIFNSPFGREVFFYPDETGNLYYITDGSPNGNCTDTVNGVTFPVGYFDGANCYLDKTLSALHGKYFRWGSPKPTAFYYKPFCKFE